jgi:hypothetical protein
MPRERHRDRVYDRDCQRNIVDVADVTPLLQPMDAFVRPGPIADTYQREIRLDAVTEPIAQICAFAKTPPSAIRCADEKLLHLGGNNSEYHESIEPTTMVVAFYQSRVCSADHLSTIALLLRL